MPGIVGISCPSHDNLFEKMVNSICHKEWYKIDSYSGSFFTIGRVHLGTFNPKPQPRFNTKKTLCVLLDGAIYNYDSTKCYNFCNDDAELCLRLFETQGLKFVEHLNGNFFITICDLKNGKLIFINDRFGSRPHYYALNNGKLLFAPEAKAILSDESFKKQLNLTALAQFLSFGYLLEQKTLFKDINTFPPGSICIYDENEFKIEKYWDFQYLPNNNLSEKDIIKKLVHLFQQALNIRINNHRYGVSLSGGLDSRTVLASISEIKKRKIITFSFGREESDELKIAKRVADTCGVESFFLPISPEMIISNAEKEVYITEGLDYIGVSYIQPIHSFIKNRIDVVFDGLALDLSLGGSYLTENVLDFKSDDESFNYLISRERSIFSERELSQLLAPKYYDIIRNDSIRSFLSAFTEIKNNDLANKIDHFLLNYHVRNWTLMGHRLIRTELEYCSPTYDNDLIDFITKIPPRLRLRHNIYRKFLKILSPEIVKIPYYKTGIRVDNPIFLWRLSIFLKRIKTRINRFLWKIAGIQLFPNKGYIILAEWIRTNYSFREFLRGLLLSEKTNTKYLFNREFIKNLFVEHDKGIRDHSLRLLHLATFELFMRLFFEDSLNFSDKY